MRRWVIAVGVCAALLGPATLPELALAASADSPVTRGAERLGVTLKAAPIGATVTSVTPGSPAASAGLQVGDNIFKVNGRIPTGHIQALKWIDASPDVLGLILRRGGGETQVSIQLPPRVESEGPGKVMRVVVADAPAEAFADAPPAAPSSAAAPQGNLRLGVALDNAGPRGVAIVDVVAGTPAQTAGLMVGDRVVRIQGMAVQGLQHAVDLVRDAPAAIVVDIKRNGIPLTLQIALAGTGGAPPAAPAEAPPRAMAGKMTTASRAEELAMAAEMDRRVEAEAEAAAADGSGLSEVEMAKLKMMKRVYLASESDAERAEIKARMKEMLMVEKAAAAGGAAPPPPVDPPAMSAGQADEAPLAASPAPAAAPAPAPVQGAVAAATTGPVGPASPLIPLGTTGKKNMNYSCSSGRAGTATVPVGSCQSDRDQYARAVACGDRGDVKRSCEQLYRCLGQDVGAYCPF